MAVWTCPVCMTEGIKSRACPKCQFCHSDNFEQFPTLVRLPSSAQPLSARRAKWLEPAEQGLFACTLCGGTAFAFDLQQLALRCLQCGKQTDIDTILKQHTNIPPVLIGCSAEAREHIYEIPISHNVIAAASLFTAGVRNDGTVLITSRWANPRDAVVTWKNIVAIAVGSYQIYGLRADGTVVAAGYGNGQISNTADWNNIIAISAGKDHVAGLIADGTVVITDRAQRRIAKRWFNVTAIAAGNGFTLALFGDGTVRACGEDLTNRLHQVEQWRDIVAICAGDHHFAGVRKDGSVVAAGCNGRGQCNVGAWTDIVAVAGGGAHTVGLRKDGTAVTTGSNENGQCNVGQWTQIVAIAAGSRHTVGLRRDGTVVATGRNDSGECNVTRWKHLMIPGSVYRVKERLP